jgi:hypothetical protein
MTKQISKKDLQKTTQEWLEKFNPYHDEIGRFTHAPGGSVRGDTLNTAAVQANRDVDEVKKELQYHKEQLQHWQDIIETTKDTDEYQAALYFVEMHGDAVATLERGHLIRRS